MRQHPVRRSNLARLDARRLPVCSSTWSGRTQLQCLTWDALLPQRRLTSGANAAVVTFMRAYGCGEDSPKRSDHDAEWVNQYGNVKTTPFG